MACLGFHPAGEERTLLGRRESLSSQLSLLSCGVTCPPKHPALCFLLESHVLVSVCPACLFLSSESLVPPAMSTNQSRPQCSGKLPPTPSQCGLSVCRRGRLSVSLYCVSNKLLKILPSVMTSFPGPVAQLGGSAHALSRLWCLEDFIYGARCHCVLPGSRRGGRPPPNSQPPFSRVECAVIVSAATS